MEKVTYKVKKASRVAIDGLRRAAKANDLTKTDMAEVIGVSRPTLNARLASGDMKLTEFLCLAVASGQKPSDVLACCDYLTAEFANDNPVSLISREVTGEYREVL